MDCRVFRQRHVGFVDDTLPAIEMRELQQHLRVCPRCARHDIAVRRGLLLVRNLPSIEPSPDFMARLNARLRELDVSRDASLTMSRPTALGLSSFAALAAGLALLGYIALEAMHRFARPVELRMPPVLATAPETPPSPLTDPAFVAAISTGMPMWPAVLMADQAPQHFANAELQEAALR
jgi:hypothetical protein